MPAHDHDGLDAPQNVRDLGAVLGDRGALGEAPLLLESLVSGLTTFEVIAVELFEGLD